MSDTLASKAYARVLDIISEGPIVGLVDGARSIYLDGTAVQNADGTANFTGLNFTQRTGTSGQDYIPGFEGTEVTTGVGVQIVEATPVTRTISDADVDAVTVVIGVPILQRTDRDDGEVVATDVRMQIDVQSSGGSWQPALVASDSIALAGSGLNLSTGGATGATVAELSVAYVVTQDTPPSGTHWVEYKLEYRIAGGSWTTHTQEKIPAPQTSVTKIDTVTKRYVYEARKTVGITIASSNAYEFRLSAVSASIAPSFYTLGMTGIRKVPSNRFTINGISSSRYQRQVTVRLPPGGAPWNLRVTRLTDDSSDSYTQDATWWDSYTTIKETKLRMPFSAGIGLTLDSEQHSNIPARGYDCRLRIIKVPTNYDPITRVYSGSWDGTFKDAWSDNPAWVFYDLVTHPRYGLGQFVPAAAVDKWGLYTIAQYCDELVPDGFGGQEPRFTCNLYLTVREEAFKVLQDLVSIFRGMLFWSSGSIYVSHDAPASADMIYSPANVVDGLFTYAGTSLKTRHTVALVTWNDPADLYKQKVEYVEDRDGIAQLGIVQTEMTAVGCASRGQAHRAGLWLLYSERMQGETVSFVTGLDTAPRRPGDIIKLADPGRAGVRYGGRLLAATTTSVTIDAPVELIAGQTYTLSCLKADGTVQETAVTTGAGTGVSVLALSPALAEAPAAGTMWVMSCDQVELQQFRVLTLGETERHQIAVTAVAHEPSKYDAIEEGLALETRSYSVLSTVPGTPANLAVTESLYARGQQLVTRLLLSWSPVQTANRYVIRWRRNGGQVQEQTVTECGTELDAVVEGQAYEITVFAQNPLGLLSKEGASLTHTVVGKMAPPADVQGFVVARSGETLNFTWTPVADVDAVRYDLRRGASWETGTAVASVAHPGNTVSVQAPRGGSYMIKAVDSSGNYSAGAPMIVAADLSGINVVLSYAESSNDWTGTCSGTRVVTVDSGTWAALTTWSAMSSWSATADPVGIELAPGMSEGTYTTVPIDIGYVATALVTLDPAVLVLGSLSDPWASYTSPWASYTDTWQPANSDAVGARFEVSTSLDGTTWTSWSPFSPGAYRFRHIRWRVTIYTTDPALEFRPFLNELLAYIDVPDRVLHFADQAVPSTGLTLAFSPPFVGLDTVQVTLQGATVGDTYTVTGKTVSGVTIRVYSSAGVAKAGNVDVDVFGYGER